MKPYSTDLRVRVLADCDAGMRTKAVAQKYRVCESWVRRLKQRRRETGEVGPRQAPPPANAATKYADAIRAAVEEKPDRTLEELRQATGLRVSVPTLSRALRQLGLTLKKSR